MILLLAFFALLCMIGFVASAIGLLVGMVALFREWLHQKRAVPLVLSLVSLFLAGVMLTAAILFIIFGYGVLEYVFLW